MTAREMFEALNFEQIRNDDNYIEYVRKSFGGYYISILFSLRWKSIKPTYGYQVRGTNYHEIPLDELKAIIQQCKELGWLEEEKQETNYEHYKDEIIEGLLLDLVLVDGKLKRCSRVDCNECEFNPGPNKGCKQRLIEWVKKPYEKPKYKLTQFEYDLINAFDRCKECCLLNEIECLKRLSQKGYFNGIDPFTKVHDIIDNCEVIK